MTPIYIDIQGGIHIRIWILRKFFPNLDKIKKKPNNILGQLKIDDMAMFTNYVETNQQ